MEFAADGESLRALDRLTISDEGGRAGLFLEPIEVIDVIASGCASGESPRPSGASR
jgi:hypothetical protein